MSKPTPIARKPWFTRTFRFDLEPWMMPNVVERLRGRRRGSRIAWHVTREVRTRAQEEGKWTLQQNAGHLLDLEPALVRPLREMLAGAAALTAADLTNKKTHEARHDERPIAEILQRFRAERTKYAAALDKLGEEQVTRASSIRASRCRCGSSTRRSSSRSTTITISRASPRCWQSRTAGFRVSRPDGFAIHRRARKQTLRYGLRNTSASGATKPGSTASERASP